MLPISLVKYYYATQKLTCVTSTTWLSPLHPSSPSQPVKMFPREKCWNITEWKIRARCGRCNARGSNYSHPLTMAGDFVLFAGVVGARNLTMECRKGRRKGLLSGLVFAWLVTSGCTVAARNIGEWQSIYDFTADSKLVRTCPHAASPSLCQLSVPSGVECARARAREYLQAARGPCSPSPWKIARFRVSNGCWRRKACGQGRRTWRWTSVGGDFCFVACG